MKLIILPVRDISRTFTDSVVRGFVEHNHPVLGDLLARHAPHSSQLIGQARNYIEYLRICDRVQMELAPFVNGLFSAIFDETLAALTEWGRTTTLNEEAVDDYLCRTLPLWGTREYFLACTDVYDRYIDDLVEIVRGWFEGHIRAEPWLMWHHYWKEDRMVIEPGVDYRVMDWMQNHQTFTGPVDTNDTVSDSDFDLINRYINEDIDQQRRQALDTIVNYGRSEISRRVRLEAPAPRPEINEAPLIFEVEEPQRPTARPSRRRVRAATPVIVVQPLTEHTPSLRLLDLVGHDAGVRTPGPDLHSGDHNPESHTVHRRGRR